MYKIDRLFVTSIMHASASFCHAAAGEQAWWCGEPRVKIKTYQGPPNWDYISGAMGSLSVVSRSEVFNYSPGRSESATENMSKVRAPSRGGTIFNWIVNLRPAVLEVVIPT